MKKIKIFLDANAISNLDQPNMAYEMADMKALWEFMKEGMYEIVISTLVIDELERIPKKDKKELIFDYLNQIDTEVHDLTDEMKEIANLLLKYNILNEKDYNDAMHIACAMVTGCDCLVSYNFDDINNIKTIKGVRTISLLQGYGDMDILTAATLIGKGATK